MKSASSWRCDKRSGVWLAVCKGSRAEPLPATLCEMPRVDPPQVGRVTLLAPSKPSPLRQLPRAFFDRSFVTKAPY